MKNIIENRIRTLAYQIWESEGCPNGQDVRHWNMARTLLNADISRSKSTAAGTVISAHGRTVGRNRQKAEISPAQTARKIVAAAGGNAQI